ncbi:hypothetical protein [Aneurinibacillus aneurinilyticus]|jgi:hypothetical protein|uniref:GAF domain-containing protein n=1 Tax=Aneurinibacillus aneurinilyticus ATCC 12856 TaxID=649747 RepID=U1Y8Q8_ANEAE|nr:hypothetical protein [Aneurinibacillus aneurinilyticus]ERI08552.1 hypothetical protein HMPREF0083_03397 [Aneurinibacillus aneurinilyticus ATCC 12856]MCI1693222.1 hypothetical protein [Aneurinibacillus aneurinilyticus]MED0671186.1 hypothetical protein [Aneurinibacillus aneurinilyticus]MED0705008.1 hypothetical protein [Aneurinibacillus aneurinilyticus]MED0721809.1 hypothetical protein [Aneurinibacillus aneurinilyticus]
MATSTAIASLETLVAIHRSNNPDEIYAQLISNFKRVPHFDWIGVYIKHGENMVRKAASSETPSISPARLSIIQIPIREKKEVLGKIMVMMQPSQSIDESDYLALMKTGEELGKKLALIENSA